jgi:hypothetical protein
MPKWLLAIALAGCSAAPARPPPPADRCAFGVESTVIRRDDKSILERWELVERPIFYEPTLPDDAAYAAYRRAIHDAHGDVEHPVADAPEPKTDEERELWRREDLNREVSYSGRGGQIRPIQCLEALLFARQNARYSELAQPTEYLASILRKQIGGKQLLRVYFGAGDMMFPPKRYYGLDEVKVDVAAGWEWVTMMHDHTVRKHGDLPALGVTTLSTSDVQLVRNLVEDGLRGARVTNGFFTIDVPASAFVLYTTRE